MEKVFYYKLVIAYEGTNFLGWQEQAKGRTVQGALRKTFKTVFNENCSIVGASRTDTGVHAEGQVARINTKLKIAPDKLLFAWGNALPTDLAIKSIQFLEDPSDFHPQHNIVEKTYRYHFYLGPSNPFLNRTALHWSWPVDIKKLKKCLKLFVGKKDFRSFCSSETQGSTVRTVNNIELQELEDKQKLYRIEIKGKSFLHNMIRRIVGACLDVAHKEAVGLDRLQEALEQKDPNQTLPNAPAHGLTLHKIEYEETK